MSEGLNLKKLVVPVADLQNRPFSRERLSARLELASGEGGLYERPGMGELKVDLVLESCPDGIHVKGTIKGHIPLQCTRCLEEYHQAVDIKVSEFYRRRDLPLVSEAGEELPEEMEVPEEDAYLIDEGRIDLNTMVNDLVLLSFPIKRLCSEECKGLCPVCGRNLNEGECGCERGKRDPRLEVLRDLLDRLQH
jgi:uncharacterized protein